MVTHSVGRIWPAVKTVLTHSGGHIWLTLLFISFSLVIHYRFWSKPWLEEAVFGPICLFLVYNITFQHPVALVNGIAGAVLKVQLIVMLVDCWCDKLSLFLTLSRRNFFEIIYINSIRTSQETHYLSTSKPNRLTLFEETVAVYCENYTGHTDTLCGQNAEF
jgi:hypothetical protein